MKFYSQFEPEYYDNALEEGMISPWMYCQIKGITGNDALDIARKSIFLDNQRRKNKALAQKKQKEQEVLEKKQIDMYIKELKKQLPNAVEKLIADSFK